MENVSSYQSGKEKRNTAKMANLPLALKDLGYLLENDSYRGFRIPGYGGLLIWKTDEGLWRWNRFSTDEHGDAVSFLVDFHEMTLPSAVKILLNPKYRTESMEKVRSKTNIPEGGKKEVIRQINKPDEKWREKASELVDDLQVNILDNPNLTVYRHLQERGLNSDTIQRSRLGWNPEDTYLKREEWGLEPVPDRPNGLWIPEGLVIPNFDKDGLPSGLAIRSFKKDRSKYYNVAGSSAAPLIIHRKGPNFLSICESFLDAWLIDQEAGDLVHSVALGTSGGKPDSSLGLLTLCVSKMLISLDADPAGRKATEWWLENFRISIDWPVPFRKDPGEAFGNNPGLIRPWIETGIA
jgi:DNA primase